MTLATIKETTMREFEDFKDIPAWQEAVHLTTMIYEHTAEGGWAVDDLLRNEIRLNTMNIATTIAKGYGMQDVLEFRKYANKARSLTFVVETHLCIAVDLEYMTQEECDEVTKGVESTRNMIDFLLDGLKRPTGRRNPGL